MPEPTEQERISELKADPHVNEVLAKAHELLQAGKLHSLVVGPSLWTILWKWTCQHCGDRVTSEQPNDLYAYYLHEDCGHETKTIDGDLGFAVMFTTGGKPKDVGE